LNDGTVWAWGDNTFGTVGDGTNGNFRKTPVQVLNLSGVSAITAGPFISLAVKNDGTVWAWGFNAFGELGDGTTVDRHLPVQVSNLTEIRAVGPTHGEHNLALKSDGTVWAWGSNEAGQLGDGTTTARHTPVQVQNLSGIIAVSAGNVHSLALKSDCTVWGWGQNAGGELGGGGSQDRLTPVQVPTLSGVPAVSASNGWSLAVAPPMPQLTVLKILVHPDHTRLRLFNLKIDGVTVRSNINGGSTGPLIVIPGSHTVSETGGIGTPLSAFGRVISGDCAADGTVNLTLGDQKTCMITNFSAPGLGQVLPCPECGDIRKFVTKVTHHKC
jgi:hypothetical protein